MHERVVQQREHGTISLHALTRDLQLDLLARRRRDVAHDAWQISDRLGEGTHPQLTNAARHFARQQIQLATALKCLAQQSCGFLPQLVERVIDRLEIASCLIALGQRLGNQCPSQMAPRGPRAHRQVVQVLRLVGLRFHTRRKNEQLIGDAEQRVHTVLPHANGAFAHRRSAGRGCLRRINRRHL